MDEKDLKKRLDDDGIEFIFAQFVDMHGKPNAKLVPVSHLKGLLEDGAGFAGFAAGPMGQTPASPDVTAMPALASYTKVPFKPGLARIACDVTVEGEPWPYCPRTILRNADARALASRLPAQDGNRAGVLPRQGGRRQADAARRPRHARAALLRHEGPDPQLRVHLDALEVLQRARLGELRQRPRGRERAVRDELRVRRLHDHRRPRDLLPLHGPRHGAGARSSRDVHAQALRQPHRERRPPPHLALGRGRARRTSSRITAIRAGSGLSPLGLPVPRRRDRARRGRDRRRRADGQLVQAASASARPRLAPRGRPPTPPTA